MPEGPLSDSVDPPPAPEAPDETKIPPEEDPEVMLTLPETLDRDPLWRDLLDVIGTELLEPPGPPPVTPPPDPPVFRGESPDRYKNLLKTFDLI